MTLFLANRISLDSGHILHGQLTKPKADGKERMKSRHPFAPAERKLLHNLSELGIRADMGHRVLQKYVSTRCLHF